MTSETMMRAFTMMGLAGVATAATWECSSSPATFHASAKVEATFDGTACDVIVTEMKARMASQGGWKDPHNGGTYKLKSEGTNPTTLEASRTTANGQYTDQLGIVFEEYGASSSNGAGCAVYGCSVSQVTSFMDYSTNFCNIHDLYCGTADGCAVVKSDLTYKEAAMPSLGAGSDKNACIGKASFFPFNVAGA